MTDEPQTRVEDAEDEDADEDALAEDAPTTASGEAAVPTDLEAADEPAEGDDATTTSDEAAVPEDPSEEEGVQDVVTADEPEEKEEALVEADEVEEDEPEAAADDDEDEEDEDDEPEAAADDEDEEEDEDEEPAPEAEALEEDVDDEEDDEPEAAADDVDDEEVDDEAAEDDEPEAAAEEPEELEEDEEEEDGAEEPEAAAEEEDEDEEEEDEEPAPAAAKKKEKKKEKEEPAEPEHVVEGTWYAIQTYSGHENKVQKLIQRRIEDEPGDTPAEKEIREVLVPTQEVVEIRNGKRVTVTKRLYPGYVLVNMELNDRTMHTINNIQGVIKFVGSGATPQPLRDEEIMKILGIETGVEKDEEEEEVPFHVGQVVEVTQGPFSDFSGTVQEVYADKGKAKVEVSLFGRPTSVELDFTQLKGY